VSRDASRVAFWAVLVGAVALAMFLGLAIGPVRLTPTEAWAALRGNADVTAVAIMRDIRAPRVALAALVGAALAMSGAALQGTLRNALAEPYLLGVSGGAAVGAVVALAARAPFGVVPIGAFGGAVAAVVLVLAIARAGAGRPDPRVLLMAGVVVGAFANAVIMIALASSPPDTTRNALWWMMGSVAAATWVEVTWLGVYAAAAGAALLLFAPEIDVLALGEDAAAGLGVNVDRAGRRAYVLASLLAAATVAAVGLVGFVGLVVPHLVRARAGRNHRAVIGAAGLAGAALVIAADLVARTLRAPNELPLGAVTALAGVPFFLAQLRRLR
jgi:iron complex transport system permease protein